MPGPLLPSAEEVSWMLEHPEDNLIPNIVACNAVAAVVATCFVTLRLWSRQVQHGYIRLVASDWFAVAAWVCFIGYTLFAAIGTRYGLGRHVVFVSNARLLTIVNIVGENFYALVVAFLKFSILSLYRTIFSSTRWFRRLAWILTALVTELAVQIIISTNVQCVPTARLWEPTLPGKCIEYGTQAFVAYIINIATDIIIIIIMPIPLIRGLKMNKRKQMGLILAFAAGGSSCLVSIVQLKYIRKFSGTADSSWEMVPSSLLATVECMTGFIATSIATYGPLYRRIFRSSGPSNSGVSDELERIRHQRGNDDGYDVQVSTGLTSKGQSSILSWHRGIMVTDQIELTRYNNVGSSWVRVPESPRESRVPV